MPAPAATGTGTAINFQPTIDGKAAIAGDFVVTAEELNPMISALRENGIEVVAIHSHMLEEQPRLFFVHFCADRTSANSMRYRPLAYLSACGAPRGARRVSARKRGTKGLRFSARHPPSKGRFFEMTSRDFAARR